MRRIACTVLLILTTATAASASDSARYFVALRGEFQPARAGALMQEIEAQPRARVLEPLGIVNGFAAELTLEEVRALRRSTAVRYVEPEIIMHKLEQSSSAPLIQQQGQNIPYGIDLVRAREVWPFSRGANVNVVVMDTGIDYNHPDIAPVYAGGFNTFNLSSDPMDDEGHGTHVAGTVAAADNSIGVVGVAPGVRLWGVKAGNSNGEFPTTRSARGVEWVVAKKRELGGNWVVNMSFGGPTASQVLSDAITVAQEAGILFVAASGNNSTSTAPAPVGYPAGLAGVMAVGAVDSSSRIASFSNQGPQLAVVAPGVSVFSLARVGTGELAGVRRGDSFLEGTALQGSSRGTVSGEYVYCGLGGTAADFPASVRGRIALIQRGGDITFNVKTRNAIDAGATAVVIFNNVPSSFAGNLILNADDNNRTWPVVIGITQADGQTLRSGSGTITVTNDRSGYDYRHENGTSMSSPHVAGVAALIWSTAPRATAAEVRQAINGGADDLGASGFDHVYGAGLVNAINAGKRLSPAHFGAPASPSPSPEPGGRRRSVGRR